MNLEQLNCSIINKKYHSHTFTSIHEIKLLDTFDIACSFIITSTTENSKKDMYFNGSLNCRIIESINIYISEQQVSLKILRNIEFFIIL